MQVQLAPANVHHLLGLGKRGLVLEGGCSEGGGCRAGGEEDSEFFNVHVFQGMLVKN
ncbi:hypothetical protein [Pseudoduganella sp. UC29_71]|uniref:hypothetical protein n=1 Tax=Pseudoduganella sp. UC29_71 TaxID=3350174 RepID=UPI00366B5449